MDHRRFRRIPFEAEVTLNIKGQVTSGELLDVAMKGALVGTGKAIQLDHGEQCKLSITLPGTPILLDFEAQLIHAEETRYGFKFVSENLATLTHLRKLIELNTGDVEATRSELTGWLND